MNALPARFIHYCRSLISFFIRTEITQGELNGEGGGVRGGGRHSAPPPAPERRSGPISWLGDVAFASPYFFSFFFSCLWFFLLKSIVRGRKRKEVRGGGLQQQQQWSRKREREIERQLSGIAGPTMPLDRFPFVPVHRKKVNNVHRNSYLFFFVKKKWSWTGVLFVQFAHERLYYLLFLFSFFVFFFLC